MKRKSFHAGFTLIELLVVLIIVGIVARIIIVNIQALRAKQRDGQRKAHLREIQAALEVYRSDKGTYAPFAGANPYGWACITNANVSSLTPYLAQIPSDPSLPSPTTCPCYLYANQTSAQRYTLFTVLENPNDPDATGLKPPPAAFGGSSAIAFTIVSGTCANTTYNYWVNSP